MTAAGRAAARHLHLLKPDAGALAASVIETDARAADAAVTVVLLDGAPAPRLPAGARVLTLGENGLDHAALLALVFESDRVTVW
jgi:hypothetical protein